MSGGRLGGGGDFVAGVLVGVFVELLAGELGVESLDGGYGDLGDGVDAGGAELLDVVELGELAAVVGGGELLEFVDGLAAEVAAVDEEEDALGAGVLNEAVAGGDGGVGLARAGGHLDEGAGSVFGKGFFQAGDGVDLAIAKRGGDQIGERQEAGAKGVGLLDASDQLFRAMEAEDAAGSGRGIALVGEISFDAGGLVNEGKRLGPALDVLGVGGAVAGGLGVDGGKGFADLFGFDDAEGFSVGEEHVVGGTGGGRELSNRDAELGGEVDLLDVLHVPAGSGELLVDGLAGLCFGGKGGHFTGGGFVLVKLLKALSRFAKQKWAAGELSVQGRWVFTVGGLGESASGPRGRLAWRRGRSISRRTNPWGGGAFGLGGVFSFGGCSREWLWRRF